VSLSNAGRRSAHGYKKIGIASEPPRARTSCSDGVHWDTKIPPGEVLTLINFIIGSDNAWIRRSSDCCAAPRRWLVS